MTLKVIGSGLGRTGTYSLKLALEQLGFGPCHHMAEVFPNPEQPPLWLEAAAGRPNWDAIYDRYRAAVDYPTAMFWRELTAYYPQAKVIHTVRDPDRWFESTQETIFAPRSPAMMAPDHLKAFFEMVLSNIGDVHDRAYMIDYFQRHDAEVRKTVSPDRLLVFEASEGWAPLCAFLGVPIPDNPFPRENTREVFKARAQNLARGQS